MHFKLVLFIYPPDLTTKPTLITPCCIIHANVAATIELSRNDRKMTVCAGDGERLQSIHGVHPPADYVIIIMGSLLVFCRTHHLCAHPVYTRRPLALA